MRNTAILVRYECSMAIFLTCDVSDYYKHLGFLSCNFLLGRKIYLLALGGLLGLGFQCLDFLFLP